MPDYSYQPFDPAGAVLGGLQASQKSRLFDLKREQMQTENQFRARSLDLKERQLAAQLEGAGMDEATAKVEFFRGLAGDLQNAGDDPRKFQMVKQVYTPMMRQVGIDPNTITFDRRGDYLAFAQQEAGELMEVSPGATLYDPQTGSAVFTAAPRETQQGREISALLDRGFSRTQAEDIAAGRVRVTSPDQFGNVYLVNTATGQKQLAGGGQATGAPQGQTAAPAQQPAQPGASRPGLVESVREGTGPWEAAKSFMDATIGGLIGQGSLFPETAENKANIRSFNQLAKGALVNNPRFPVAEQEIVARMLPNPDAIFTNPENEVQKLETLRQTLQDVLAVNQRAMESGQITQEELGVLANKNAEIRRVLSLMGGAATPQPQRQPVQRGFEGMSDDEVLRSLGIR